MLSLGLFALLVSCDEASTHLQTSPESQTLNWGTSQTIEHLPGTWVRVDGGDASVIKKNLILNQNGDFSESTLIALSNGQTQAHRHTGKWLFDGVNLKRKYDLMDGRAPSRMNLPFVTFEIHFLSKNEFEGIDHIHNNHIHYVRESSDQSME
jgi:hypothetical protein